MKIATMGSEEPKMQRRQFLTTSLLATGGVIAFGNRSQRFSPLTTTEQVPPAWSYDPVIGDGRWIWKDPPKSERGYLEPRSYEVSIGIELQGVDDYCEAMASTPVPLAHPEQQIDDVSIEQVGCKAVIRELASGAGQLILHAPSIEAGQVVKAIVNYKMTLFKQYHAFQQEQFPAKQSVPKEIAAIALGESPGIQVASPAVKKLATAIGQGYAHPWEKAEAFVRWIRESIRPQLGAYTSVLTAIQKRVGDCEEMSALFVAFCRASGIPARLVWIPNHNWAEFYLTDHENVGHWIPVHPACYNWFGWTGAHELVIQKGDRVIVPEQGRASRLLMDWMRSSGRPNANYIATLTPVASSENDDPGPGARSKDKKTGEWKLSGKHKMDRFARR